MLALVAMVAMEILLVLVGTVWIAIMNVIVVQMVVILVAEDALLVKEVLVVQVTLVVVKDVLAIVIMDVMAVFALIARIVLIAINVQIAKLAIHNVIQIINALLCIYIHYQLDRYYHLYHCINSIQLNIRYI